MGQSAHFVCDAVAESDELHCQTIKRLAYGCGARKKCDRSVPQVLADVLEVVAELEEHSPAKGEAALLRRKPAPGKAGVRKDRGASFGAAQVKDLGGAGLIRAELDDAVLLGAVDGEQAIVDARVKIASVLTFDKSHELPQSRLMRVARGYDFASKAESKALAELSFGLCANAGLVQIVVRVGVQQAVAEYRGGELDLLTEKRLQTAGGPSIATGLDDIFLAEIGIEAPRPSGQAGACREEVVGEELDRFGLEVERLCRKSGEGCSGTRLGLGTLGYGSWMGASLSFDVGERFVVDLLAAALVLP